MESRGSPAVAALPEVLIASAEFRAAQGDDGIGPLDGPVHASPLEACSDHHFASRFEDAGGGTQTLSVKLRVAHASAIAEDIQRIGSPRPRNRRGVGERGRWRVVCRHPAQRSAPLPMVCLRWLRRRGIERYGATLLWHGTGRGSG